MQSLEADQTWTMQSSDWHVAADWSALPRASSTVPCDPRELPLHERHEATANSPADDRALVVVDGSVDISRCQPADCDPGSYGHAPCDYEVQAHEGEYCEGQIDGGAVAAEAQKELAGMSYMQALPPGAEWAKLQQRVSELRAALAHQTHVSASLRQQVCLCWPYPGFRVEVVSSPWRVGGSMRVGG
jgi:hypothetical protein